MSKSALQAVLVSAVLALVAALSAVFQQPLVAPSLGSAVFVQVISPTEPSAHPWNTAIGQMVGVAAGLIGVYVAAATTVPSFMGDHALVWARVVAVAIAVAFTVLGGTALKATSPAGGATAIVIAIGAETANIAGCLRMVAAIIIVTTVGEVARRTVIWFT